MQERNTMQQITAALIVIAIIVSGLSYMNGQKINSNIAALTDTTEALESRVEDSSDILGDLAEVVGVLGTSMGEIGESVGEYGEEIATILEKIEALEEIEETKTARRLKWEEWANTLYVGTTAMLQHPDTSVGSLGLERADTWYRTGKLLYPDPETPGEYLFYYAKSYELKQNTLGEWYIEYKMKEGLKFPDGTDIDAEAVKYSWEREATLFYRTNNAETTLKHWIDTTWARLEVPDKYTFWQFLPEGAEEFMPLTMAVYLTHIGMIVSPTSTEKWCKENDVVVDMINQVGAGPYILTELIPYERAVYRAWEDMPENPLGAPTKAKIDNLILISYADPTTLRLALEMGDIDIVVQQSLARSDIPDLDANPDIIVQQIKGMAHGVWVGMSYRPEFAPLNDVRVRKAIAYAIFPEEIVEKTLFNLGEVADSIVHKWIKYYIPAFGDMYRTGTYEERIAKAKELLTEAGYPDGFKTDFWIASPPRPGRGSDQATIIQSQLAKIGIELTIKSVDAGSEREMDREGRFAMSFGGWRPDYADADTDLYAMMDNTGSRYAAYIGYDNEHVRDLIKQGWGLYDFEGDPPERRLIYEELQTIWADEVVGVNIFYDACFDAYRSWVKGYSIPWHNKFGPVWDAYKEIPADWELYDPPQ